MLAPRERQRFLMWFIFGIFIAGILGETIEKTIILHGNEDLAKVLEEAMPKRCYKDGKDYAEGEAFQGGHLRYRCQKFGVYVIEGCRTDGGKDLDVGDRVLEENLLSQCFKEGNSIFFRQTVCGIIGMPACDKITPHSKRFSLQEIASQAANFTMKAQRNEKKQSSTEKILTSTLSNKEKVRFLPETSKIERNSIVRLSEDDCPKKKASKSSSTSQKQQSNEFSTTTKPQKFVKLSKNLQKSFRDEKLKAQVKSNKKLKNSEGNGPITVGKLPITVSTVIPGKRKTPKPQENLRKANNRKHSKNLREYLLEKKLNNEKSRNVKNSLKIQKTANPNSKEFKIKKKERKMKIFSKISTTKNDFIKKFSKNLKQSITLKSNQKKQLPNSPICSTNPQMTSKMRIKKDSPLLGVAGMQEVGSVSRTISTQVGSPSTLEDSPGLPYGWHIVGKSNSGMFPTQNIHLLSKTFHFPNPLN